MAPDNPPLLGEAQASLEVRHTFEGKSAGREKASRVLALAVAEHVGQAIHPLWICFVVNLSDEKGWTGPHKSGWP